jgi:hypothetical protein
VIGTRRRAGAHVTPPCFAFSDTELIDGWCSHERLFELLRAPETVVTGLHVAKTFHGEWVTLDLTAPLPATRWSGPGDEPTLPVMPSLRCIGPGYSTLREQWITDRWYFQPAAPGDTRLPLTWVWAQLAARREHCFVRVAGAPLPSERALGCRLLIGEGGDVNGYRNADGVDSGLHAGIQR